MKSYILIISILMGLCLPAHAQTRSALSAEEEAQIKERIVGKLEDFQYFLGEMANKKNSQQVRNDAHKSNRQLFIGKCEPYTVTNISTGAPEKRSAVKMETSSVSNGKERRRQQLMKQYFINLMNNRAYSNIKIEQSKTVRVDNIRKVGDGKYEAVAHFYQYFIGYGGDGIIRYGDQTEKAVRILIDYDEVPTPDGVDRIFDIKLGDMKVVLTERL